jgi:hypothetical protein
MMNSRVCQLDLEMQQNIKIKKVGNMCSALKVEITPFMQMYQDCGVTSQVHVHDFDHRHV